MKIKKKSRKKTCVLQFNLKFTEKKINRQIETLFIFYFLVSEYIHRIYTIWTSRRSHEKSLDRANIFFSSLCFLCLNCILWCVFNWALLFRVHVKCCFLNLNNQSVYKSDHLERFFFALTYSLSRSLSRLIVIREQTK